MANKPVQSSYLVLPFVVKDECVWNPSAAILFDLQPPFSVVHKNLSHSNVFMFSCGTKPSSSHNVLMHMG